MHTKTGVNTYIFSIGDQDIEMITNTRYLGVQMTVNSTGTSISILSRPRLIEPLDLSSILRNIFHLTYSKKCIEGFLSPISATVVPFGAAVVNQSLTSCKKSKIQPPEL